MLLECNVRFGDPETQATLPRLATPLLPLLAGVARGRLAEAAARAGITGTLLPVHPGSRGRGRRRGRRLSRGPSDR